MAGTVPQIEVGKRDDLVEVRLLRLPIAVHQVASEHGDELRREFTLLRVQQDDPASADVPSRLLDLIEELQGRFAGFIGSTRADLEEAIERGETHVDLVFHVPADVREGAQRLGTLLEEVDQFCRSGATLLTLETPPEAMAYRRWYLQEFIRQADGEAPRPWSGA